MAYQLKRIAENILWTSDDLCVTIHVEYISYGGYAEGTIYYNHHNYTFCRYPGRYYRPPTYDVGYGFPDILWVDLHNLIEPIATAKRKRGKK